MGKGNKRREFDVERERAFARNHTRTYAAPPKRPGKTIYAVSGGDVIPKPSRKSLFGIVAIDPGPFESFRAWQEDVETRAKREKTLLDRLVVTNDNLFG